MANIQVTSDSNVAIARSESAIVINPNNPQQMVSASKKFRNLTNYDFTMATSYSTDGGYTWHDSSAFALPAGANGMSDPTLAWDDAGNVYSLGLVAKNPPNWTVIGMAAYKSTDGGKTWSAPKLIHNGAGDDKQWIAGDTNPASPYHGRVYGVWDDGSSLAFARTIDNGATWISTGNLSAGTTLTTGSCFSPEINVSDNGDVYIAFLNSKNGNAIRMMKSTDGGNSFTEITGPATGISTIGPVLQNAGSWLVFPGATFRFVATVTCCVKGQDVLVAWDDFREGNSRIYCALSSDGGMTWSTGPSGKPMLTSASIQSGMHHFFPQLIVDANGVIGCTFYEFGMKQSQLLIDVLIAQSFDKGSNFQYFTVTDQAWDPKVAAPFAPNGGTPNSNATFIGDYFGIDASPLGFYPLWTDTRTGKQELFTAIVPEKKISVVMNRSTIGQDEIDARRTQPANSPGGLPVPDAFAVVFDGFTAAQLGVNSQSGNLTVLPIANPGNGMAITSHGNKSSTGGYGPEVQRFTFFFNLNFNGNSAFAFPSETEMVTIGINIFNQVAMAEMQLIKQPNPFILHGDPDWLSIDLRVFVVRENESKFGVAGIANSGDAPRFIQQVINTITLADFESLPKNEEDSKLYTQIYDEDDKPVYNFALAKVHYIGLIGATNVRVFFRMFQAQSTSTAFNPATTYRRAASNPDGHPIPLPGIGGNEFVTVPFFANGRVDSTMVTLDRQTDPFNIKTIAAAGGTEVNTFFGCWIDINQFFKPGYAQWNNVLPLRVPSSNINGPFNDPSNPAQPLGIVIKRNQHQCLIAEIAFDPISIPFGKDPSNWDKLAQRNIAFSDVGSAQGVTTFQIKPSRLSKTKDVPVDELMIDWGGLPKGCIASIFVPAVKADTILGLSTRMYDLTRFTRLDEHTLQCPAEGITYMPIPEGNDDDFPGLLSIKMPDNLPQKKVYNVIVRQITHGVLIRDSGHSLTHSGFKVYPYRKVAGAFQLTIPVKNKNNLLVSEERDLSVLRWIGQSIPYDNRWFSVFQRYLGLIEDRVTSFGGNPSNVHASPFGDGKKFPKQDQDQPGEDEKIEYTGKVSLLLFDKFGDFEGFVLKTKQSQHQFYSREKDVEILAETCWRQRLRITVTVSKNSSHSPLSFFVHEPPATFGQNDN